MPYVLALHLIFMVSWFAGLFYIVRLFVYSAEANLKTEPERGILLNQFEIMKKRLLYGITWPAGILTIVFGVWLLIVYVPLDIFEAWFILKMIFVALLILYHMQCQIIYTQQKHRIFKFSSMKLRVFNEVATVVLFAAIFLVEIRQNTNWVYAVLGGFLLIGLILLGIFLYNKQRVRAEDQKSDDNSENREPPPLAP